MQSESGELEARLERAAEVFRQGGLAEARARLEALRPAIDAHPGGLHLRALVERGLGRLDDAIASIERALELAPRDAALHGTLGSLWRERGAFDRALAAYRRALEVAPDDRTALHNLATLHLARGEARAAVERLERLRALEPRAPEIWNLLGIACSDADDVGRAVEALERAVALAPGAAEFHANLGVAYGYAGRGDDARRALRRALEIDPGCVRAWEGLVRSARVGEGDRADVERIERLLGAAPEGSEARITLGFALGKAFDDLGEPERAFEHYRIGNASMRRRVRYDERAARALFDALIAIQDRAWIEARAGCGSDDDTAVFVVGMPRSGTTLVEQLLGAHPRVHGAGELLLVPRAVEALCAGRGGFPRGLAAAGDERIGEQARALASGLGALGRGALRVVDKLPGNYLHLATIRTLLPRAAIVHCRRDPLDTCLSIYFQRFSRGHEYAYDLEDIAGRYLLYRRLMSHWRAVLGGGILDVDYEQLVADPLAVGRRITEHVGLEFDPAQLERLGAGAVRTASAWQVRGPIHRGSVGRWRRYSALIGPLVERLAGLD